jgi:hypothetical protein
VQRDYFGVGLMGKRITVRLVFGALQSIFAFSAIVLAFLLEFNLGGVRASWEVSLDAVNFYVYTLLATGLVFLIGGLFLVYDWWEMR